MPHIEPAHSTANRTREDFSLTYVLITPARNEEAFIELTIQAVQKQTVRPLKWVIVSDGSTDRTDEIVRSYALQHDWIDFIRMPEREARDFSGKVGCFNAGYARCKHLDYDIMGSLDADISFQEDYFAFLLRKFDEDPKLGVGGTPFNEGGETYDYRFSSSEHVSGACQLFRRKCFEAIGGYLPMKGGGIDVVAVQMAKMKGWRTRTFPEKFCIHHRPMGSANHRDQLRAKFQLGRRAYTLGWHPAWQIFRSAYQMTRRPYLTGGLALSLGYFWSMLKRADRLVPIELVEFQRRDQMKRLKAFLKLDSRKEQRSLSTVR